MDRRAAETTVIASAIVVSSIYGYRKLIEPAGSAIGFAKPSESALKRIIGAEPQPPTVPEFAVAFGFTYMTLSVMAVFVPDLAGGFAILVMVGELLTNGASVFTDVNHVIAESANASRQGIASNPATARGIVNPANEPAPARGKLTELPQAGGLSTTLGKLR